MKKLALLWLVLFAAMARADSPMPPPSVQKTWSANHRFFVVTHPTLNQTQVYDATTAGHPRRTWRMSGYFRDLHLSNNGQHLVAGYDGMNLLQLDYKPGDVLIRFYSSGHLIGVVTVAQLFPDRSQLISMVSHYFWGQNVGFDKLGRYVVTTVKDGVYEGRTLFYNAATGKQIQ